MSDVLVNVWRLYASGREQDAAAKLLVGWSAGMDGRSGTQDGRVALKLLDRLGFTTDAADEWAALPDPLTVYRAGGPGLAWTADADVASAHAAHFDLGPVRTRTVAKADVLAYITGYGESEVIL